MGAWFKDRGDSSPRTPHAEAHLDWIAVDWGTSNVRAWGMDGDRVEAEASSDQGMGKLARDGFEPALRDLVGEWPALPIIACGMVGARQGWVEAPYARVPCAPVAGPLTRAPMDVRIVPGLSQDDPPDVMRGEETKVAGFLALNEGWDGTLLLPGTHPKWVAVSAGEVTGFRTSLTGELFAALSEHTVLRHSFGTGWDDAAFEGGVAEGIARPEQLAARLFAIRAEGLLRGLSPDAARARASGLLIGADLAGAKAWWLGAQVALLGAGKPADAWAAALAQQGAAPLRADATEATLAGLASARRLA